jgi:hypothetical protein
MPLYFQTGSVSTAMEKAFYYTSLLFMNGSSKKRLALFVLLWLSPNQPIYRVFLFMAICYSSFAFAIYSTSYEKKRKQGMKQQTKEKNKACYSILEVIYIWSFLFGQNTANILVFGWCIKQLIWVPLLHLQYGISAKKKKNQRNYSIIWFSLSLHWKAGIHILDWCSILSFFSIYISSA